MQRLWIIAIALYSCAPPVGTSKGNGGLDIQEPDDTPLFFSGDNGIEDTESQAEITEEDIPTLESDTPAPGPDVPDSAQPGCQEGSACNDENPCTVNDQCTNGQCQGSLINCDDKLPCTTDLCKDGLCTHPIADGFCKIEGVCYANAQKNPTNQCQRCSQPQSQSAWSHVDGGGCDDGDLCTGPDICLDGQCTSQAIACPDDGNSCTLEVCTDGECSSKANVGVCEDGNPCTVGDFCDKKTCQPGPDSKDADKDGSIDFICPDGNDCNDSDDQTGPLQPEICDDQKDNNCNNLVDEEEASCKPAGKECSTHNDCYPLTVCAVWNTTGTQTCSKPCAGKSDCEVGQICSKLPGSTQVGFCQNAPLGLLSNGANCTDELQCQSSVCADGICADLCLDQSHCMNANSTCHPVGDLQAGKLMGACSTNPPGLKTNGMICSMSDGFSFGSGACASGHCDLLNTNATVCAPLCTSESDCAPSQECNIVLYATAPHPDYVPYHPQFTQPTYDTLSACYTPPSAGFMNDGQVCTSAGDCKSYKCLALVPGDTTKYCTSFCTGDSECPASMACKLEVVNLSSLWLANNFNGSQSQAPGAYSLVRICKLP